MQELIKELKETASISTNPFITTTINLVIDMAEEKAKQASDCPFKSACMEVVKTYEGDGMEGMETRDKFIYNECKTALDSDC